VVACWIAVAFDLVDKIREVAASGDAMAQEVKSGAVAALPTSGLCRRKGGHRERPRTPKQKARRVAGSFMLHA
jgi:hypothetical protein